MIARKEIDSHSPVHQCSKGCKHTDISLWNDIAVFVPEVPDITKQIDRLRIGRQTLQEIHETTFPAHRVTYLQPQMYIRYEI